jgi:hypothetical protein
MAVAFLAIGSVVQASIHHHRRHHSRDRAYARFVITGLARTALSPGVTAPVDVTLHNRIHHVLWISDLKLTLGVDAAHAAAGCSVARDYIVTQLPRSTYPIRLPARSDYSAAWPARLRWVGSRGWRLRELGVPVAPAISMVNLPNVDQDGCKGAKLRLSFWATSRLNPPYVRVRSSWPPRR